VYLYKLYSAISLDCVFPLVARTRWNAVAVSCCLCCECSSKEQSRTVKWVWWSPVQTKPGWTGGRQAGVKDQGQRCLRDDANWLLLLCSCSLRPDFVWDSLNWQLICSLVHAHLRPEPNQHTENSKISSLNTLRNLIFPGSSHHSFNTSAVWTSLQRFFMNHQPNFISMNFTMHFSLMNHQPNSQVWTSLCTFSLWSSIKLKAWTSLWTFQLSKAAWLKLQICLSKTTLCLCSYKSL
jgi:hypothetical protein